MCGWSIIDQRTLQVFIFRGSAVVVLKPISSFCQACIVFRGPHLISTIHRWALLGHAERSLVNPYAISDSDTTDLPHREYNVGLFWSGCVHRTRNGIGCIIRISLLTQPPLWSRRGVSDRHRARLCSTVQYSTVVESQIRMWSGPWIDE